VRRPSVTFTRTVSGGASAGTSRTRMYPYTAACAPVAVNVKEETSSSTSDTYGRRSITATPPPVMSRSGSCWTKRGASFTGLTRTRTLATANARAPSSARTWTVSSPNQFAAAVRNVTVESAAMSAFTSVPRVVNVRAPGPSTSAKYVSRRNATSVVSSSNVTSGSGMRSSGGRLFDTWTYTDFTVPGSVSFR